MNDQFNLNFVNCDDTSEYKCNVSNISRDLIKSNLILKVNCLLRQAVRWKNLAIIFVTTEWEQSRFQTYQRPFKGKLKEDFQQSSTKSKLKLKKNRFA